MLAFSTFVVRAAERTGGIKSLEQLLPCAKTDKALRAVADSMYLSQMSLRIFRAGLKHSMVDAKWPAFEEVFFGFDPHRIRAMSDEDLEHLMADSRLIRHWGKIRAVRDNAAAMIDISSTHNGFGHYLAEWSTSQIMALWDDLAQRFHQLGGQSGANFLRMAGKDTFLLTADVVAALVSAKVIEGKPTSKRARETIQNAFNDWARESGRPLCQISKILALSVQP